jgi:hypothetical protein
MEFECEPGCDGDPAYGHSENCPSRAINDYEMKVKWFGPGVTYPCGCRSIGKHNEPPWYCNEHNTDFSMKKQMGHKMKTFTAAEIADDRANFKILGARRFVHAEVAEELRTLLAIAEVSIRTNHRPPTEWHERTMAAIKTKIRCPELPYDATSD